MVKPGGSLSGLLDSCLGQLFMFAFDYGRACDKETREEQIDWVLEVCPDPRLKEILSSELIQ